MKDLVAVCRREILERRLGLLLAAAIGLVPLALPWLPAVHHHTAGDVRIGAALLLGAIVALGGAVALGGSIWASDFTTGRLGFYLSRPIRSWAIWGGKLAALVILLTAITGLTVGPGLLAGDGLSHGTPFDFLPDWRTPTSASSWSWNFLALFALALMSHLVRTLAVRRSGLLLLDITFVLTASGVVALFFRRLLAAPAPGDLMRGEHALVAGIALVALTAIVIETALGRLDAVRGRRLFSLVVCSGLGTLALATWFLTRWTLGASIGDLRDLAVGAVSRDGRWLFLGGPARHRVDYSPGFLYDIETRAVRPLGGVLTGSGTLRVREQLAFSDDGSHAFWIHVSPLGVEGQVIDLATHAAPLELVSPSAYVPQAISPSGRFVATASRGRIGVIDLRRPGQPLVVTATLGDDWPAWVRFVGEDRVRLLTRRTGDDRRAMIRDLVLGRGTLDTVCQTPPLADAWSSRLSQDGAHMAAVLTADESPSADAGTAARRLALLSTSDCSLLADLGTWRYNVSWEPHFLADGRLIASEKSEAGRTLRLYDRDGHLLRSFELPARRSLNVGGLLASQLLVVSIADGAEPSRTEILDLTTGERRPLGTGLRPVASYDVAPGSLATRVFSTPTGLVLVDPATGARTMLVSTAPSG